MRTVGEHTRPDAAGAALDLLTISRAMAMVAIGVVHTFERAMVGPDRVRTARGNAWEAICAERERASRRDEIRRTIATLAAARAGRDDAPATALSVAATPGTGGPVTGTPTARVVRHRPAKPGAAPRRQSGRGGRSRQPVASGAARQPTTARQTFGPPAGD